jgi:anthranilate synthase component II
MILLIDNYDSFTYNLYQYMGLFNTDILVKRNDEISVADIKKLNPEKIVISPGPKAPKDAGICMEVIKEFGKQIPIMGICLGHQCIAEAYGATVSYAKKIFHGKQSLIVHNQKDLFEGIESEIKVARYHSLAIVEETMPECLIVTARTNDGEIMGIKHKDNKVFGLQFHPESIYTEHGKKMIENFISM